MLQSFFAPKAFQLTVPEHTESTNAMVREFLTRACKAKEQCILDAMAKGIDLHEMELDEDIEVASPDGRLKYHCTARRVTA
jgi:hypothetical protein